MIKDLSNVEYFEQEMAVTEDTQGGGLVMLSVDKLYPHPDNPRKKLGDLSELADSIKAKGIMQNLTVVPRVDHPGTYTIIIGHRRHGAAKKAGLKELPCVIVEMSEQEQIATMLLENIQRSDLTAYEQAKGFQMMMDFGDSVSQIVEKTGFSESTVRRRLKMAELDEGTLEKVSARQLSLGDFDKLAEIEDIEVRNKVLQDIGTNNFNSSIKSALNDQKLATVKKDMEEAFEAAGFKKISGKEYTNYSYQTSISGTGNLENGIARAKEYNVVGYYSSYNDCYYMMSEKSNASETKSAAQLEREKTERERVQRTNRLSVAVGKAYDLRREFIEQYSIKQALINLNKIVAFLTISSINRDLNSDIDINDMDEFVFGRETAIQSYEEMVAAIDPSHAAKTLLVSVWLLTDSEYDTYDWYGRYRERECLNMVYDFLESLGYLMSDEERELLDGTSELYYREEK